MASERAAKAEKRYREASVNEVVAMAEALQRGNESEARLWEAERLRAYMDWAMAEGMELTSIPEIGLAEYVRNPLAARRALIGAQRRAREEISDLLFDSFWPAREASTLLYQSQAAAIESKHRSAQGKAQRELGAIFRDYTERLSEINRRCDPRRVDLRQQFVLEKEVRDKASTEVRIAASAAGVNQVGGIVFWRKATAQDGSKVPATDTSFASTIRRSEAGRHFTVYVAAERVYKARGAVWSGESYDPDSVRLLGVLASRYSALRASDLMASAEVAVSDKECLVVQQRVKPVRAELLRAARAGNVNRAKALQKMVLGFGNTLAHNGFAQDPRDDENVLHNLGLVVESGSERVLLIGGGSVIRAGEAGPLHNGPFNWDWEDRVQRDMSSFVCLQGMAIWAASVARHLTPGPPQFAEGRFHAD